MRYSTSAGSSATLPFTGRGVAWVSPKTTGRGQAEISIDGAYVATIDLASGPSGPRWIAFTRSWPDTAPHKITVRVLGTTGRPRVDIDAFVVLR